MVAGVRYSTTDGMVVRRFRLVSSWACENPDSGGVAWWITLQYDRSLLAFYKIPSPIPGTVHYT